MKIRYLGFFAIAIIVAGCFKNLDPPIESEYFYAFVDPADWQSDNPISFLNPEIGQISNYHFLEGRQITNDDVLDDFDLKAAVIGLEIIDQDHNGYLIEETMRPRSEEAPHWYKPDSTYQYYMKIDQENQEVTFYDPDDDQIMSIFFGYDPITLSLVPFTNQEIEIIGWKTTLPFCICEQTAYTNDYILNGVSFNYLNIYINNWNYGYHGEGYTYVYSADYGIVHFMSYHELSAYGWNLIGKQ